MVDIKKEIDAINSKRMILGKKVIYKFINGMACVDLAEVDDKNLVVPSFITGIINTRVNCFVTTNNTLEKIEFGENIRFIQKQAFTNFIKLKNISDMDKVEELECKGLLYGCNSLKCNLKLPKWADINECYRIPQTDMRNMFAGCNNITVNPFIKSKEISELYKNSTIDKGYFMVVKGKVLIDLNKVKDEILIIENNVYGLVNSRKSVDIENNIIREIHFGDNIKYIHKDALKNFKKLDKISALENIEMNNKNKLLDGCDCMTQFTNNTDTKNKDSNFISKIKRYISK